MSNEHFILYHSPPPLHSRQFPPMGKMLFITPPGSWGNTSRGILHILWGWSFKHLYPVNRVLPESALGRLRPFQYHSILTTVQLIVGMVWLIKNAGSTQNISLFAPPTPNPHPYHRLDAGVGLHSTLYTLKVIPARDEWVHILNSVQYKQYSTVQYSTVQYSTVQYMKPKDRYCALCYYIQLNQMCLS